MGNCSDGASKGANIVTVGAVDRGGGTHAGESEGRKENALRGPTALEREWSWGGNSGKACSLRLL
jgi:hypothetical protein